MQQVTETIAAAIGKVTATATFPEELVGVAHVPEVSLTFRPQTVEEAEAIIEACGGRGVFRFPRAGTHYDSPAYAGTPGIAEVGVMLYPPPRSALDVPSGPIEPAPHAFFGRFEAEKAGA